MTPHELRAAQQALAKRIGPTAQVDISIWSSTLFDRDPPIRALVFERNVSFSVEADTFEEALAKAESEWTVKREEYRRTAIEQKRAELAALEGAA